MSDAIVTEEFVRRLINSLEERITDLENRIAELEEQQQN